jgi:hypothetical protein
VTADLTKGAGERMLDRLRATHADPEGRYPLIAGSMTAAIDLIAEKIERAREERTLRDMRGALDDILVFIERFGTR